MRDGHAHSKPIRYVPRDGDGFILVIGGVTTCYNTDSLMGRQDLPKPEVYLHQ